MSASVEPVKKLESKPGEIPTFLTSTINKNARAFMSITLSISDALSLAAAVLAAVGIRWLAGILLPYVVVLLTPLLYLTLIPIVLIFLLIYKLWGLYPAIGLGPVEELRRLITSTTIVFTAFTAFTFWVRSAEIYSRLVIAFSAAASAAWQAVSRPCSPSLVEKMAMTASPMNFRISPPCSCTASPTASK